MTELEGAILGLLRAGKEVTRYAVRRQFEISRSAEWSGSAGAIYPAIQRLQAAGLVGARKQKDGRGTQTYALTKKGLAAHDEWLCDVLRAAGPGMDPFRTRAALWAFLPPARRRALMKDLQRQIGDLRDAYRHDLNGLDPLDEITQELVLLQLETRLEWLKRQ